jgi:hypothetical protein
MRTKYKNPEKIPKRIRYVNNTNDLVFFEVMKSMRMW